MTIELTPTLEEIAAEEARLKDQKAKARAKAKADKEAAKEKERADKEAAKTKAKEEKEELSNEVKWNCFQDALKIYNDYKVSFFRDSTPKYFYKLQTKKKNKITKKEEHCTEVKWIPPQTLYPNWVELKHPFSQIMFRKMIEGERIKMFNPETEEEETFTFPSRLYSKLVNTVDEVDEQTYNLLDLSSVMKPNYNKDEQQKCPTIIKALLFALSGCAIMWNEDEQRWAGSKEENLEWLERWSYGVLHANIGNNMLSMPVIFGKGKVGKNAYFDIIFSIILGAELRFTGLWETIDGGFNAFKMGKTFIFGDEIPMAGEWNKIKNATGSLKQYIKIKYGVEMETDNCVSYAWGSNQELFPLPFEDGPQMGRVSPIKVGASTFAENVVKMLDKEHGENYVENLLKAAGIDTSKMSQYDIGDAALRGVLSEQWQSHAASQQFLNYLDQTYKSERYHLPPLRGQDWTDIAEYKKDAIRCTADFIGEHNPDIITVHEVHEIYKVIQSERNSIASKQLNSTTETIKPYLLDLGYCYKKDATLADNTRSNIFCKGGLEHGAIRHYAESHARYIKEELVHGKTQRRLVVPTVKNTKHSSFIDNPVKLEAKQIMTANNSDTLEIRPKINVQDIINSVKATKKD